MSLEEIKGNIEEYCIACLSKSPNMYNLSEDIDKKTIFTTIFNCEFEDYADYPHFLCSVCDVKLNITYSFQQDVIKNLAILKDYKKLSKGRTEEEEPKIVNIKIVECSKAMTNKYDSNCYYKEADIYDTENDSKLKKFNDTCKLKKTFSTKELVDVEEIQRHIEEFQNEASKRKVCVLCGFFSMSRRAIASHVTSFHKDKKHKYCLECNDFLDNCDEHKKTHSNQYVCPYCEKNIAPSGFIEHLQGHSGLFKCTICNKNFQTATWLKKHAKIHSASNPFICPNCSKSFFTRSALRSHLNTHGEYTCNTCTKHFFSEVELKNHDCNGNILLKNQIWLQNSEEDSDVKENIVETAEDSSTLEQDNFCKLCDKIVESLTEHTEKYHKQLQENSEIKVEFECETCQKTYSSINRLRMHMRLHTDEQPYKCKFCDKRSVNRSNLLDHERTHTREKPYICSVCGKALSQAAALRTHMKQHTGRPEVCELCDKRFCRKSELKLHMMKHQGEKPFLCTKCGKTYAQRSHLTEHMTAHSDERPFKCHHCDKAFKKKVLLREHVKLHEDEKRFKCTHCFYACHKAYRLQQHMKQHISESFEEIELPKVEQNQNYVETDLVQNVIEEVV